MNPAINPAITEPTFDVHLDPEWSRQALIDDVRRGFGRRPLRLPPRWLYDDRGSELFDQIKLPKVEEVWFKGADGSDLNGWIMFPPNTSKKLG